LGRLLWGCTLPSSLPFTLKAHWGNTLNNYIIFPNTLPHLGNRDISLTPLSLEENEELTKALQERHIFPKSKPDHLIWDKAKVGSYSVKERYNCLVSQQNWDLSTLPLNYVGTS